MHLSKPWSVWLLMSHDATAATEIGLSFSKLILHDRPQHKFQSKERHYRMVTNQRIFTAARFVLWFAVLVNSKSMTSAPVACLSLFQPERVCLQEVWGWPPILPSIVNLLQCVTLRAMFDSPFNYCRIFWCLQKINITSNRSVWKKLDCGDNGEDSVWKALEWRTVIMYEV